MFQKIIYSAAALALLLFAANSLAQTGNPALPADCRVRWWFDSSRPVCSQKQFCGEFSYRGLRTFETESACQAAAPGSNIAAPSEQLSSDDLAGLMKEANAKIKALRKEMDAKIKTTQEDYRVRIEAVRVELRNKRKGILDTAKSARRGSPAASRPADGTATGTATTTAH